LNYKKASKSQLTNYKENYTQLFPVHPVSTLKGSTISDYDRTIEKCQKAIKTHSIKTKPNFVGLKTGSDYKTWLQIEEYNPFLHHAWMMMAQAQFFKGDFLAASSTFNYIARHFRNLPQTVLEAQIWNARCLAEFNSLYDAEDALHKIKLIDLNKRNTGLWNLFSADLKLKQQQSTNAIPLLLVALANENDNIQRYRLNFLLGQIYAQNGDNKNAYLAFEKVIKLSPPYETEFTARIRQTECMDNTDNGGAVLRKLIGMSKKSKNKDFLDQLYYAIGNIYLTKKDTVQATKYYTLSVEKSEKSINQKSISQIKLGDIYFNQKKYVFAQPCYSGALSAIGKDHLDYARLSKRSEALDELIINYQGVHLQDSLLNLSTLSEAEKLKVITKIIAQLEKAETQEKKLAEREKLLAQQSDRREEMNGEGVQNAMPSRSTPNMNADKSWYFYNVSSVAKGKTDFQSRWGSRKLEDNWRRKNKMNNSFGETATQKTALNSKKDSTKTDSLKTTQIVDPKTPQFYLQQIPSTPLELQNANDIVRDGMYNMALIYKNRLEDFPLSLSTFEELMKRYPDTPNKPDIYYNMYMIGQIQNDTKGSDLNKKRLIEEFPKNKYSIALADPDFVANYIKKAAEVEVLYENAYQAYLKNDITFLRSSYEEAKTKFPLSKLMPKFAFLNALSFLSEKRTQDFKLALTELLEKYTDSEITTLAGSMMSNLAKGKLISGQSVSTDIWSMAINTAKSEKENAGNIQLSEFTVDPISPHLVLFVYPTDSTYNNRLMYDVAGFNFTNFAIRDFDFDMFPLQGIGLLRVKGFASLTEVQIYYERLFGAKGIAQKLPSQLKTVLISEKNFDSLLKGRTFAEYFTFFDKNFKKK
jgi:tetratricopeptide (TPR) repeat protein